MRARFLALLCFVAAACNDVPIDDSRTDKRLFPPRGVIRGTVTYVGPRPCTKDGHVVGNAVLLVFNRRNPPPPAGIATNAVNFVAVPGDALFVNEPRSIGTDLYCPSPTNAAITAAAPFAIAPLDAGSYMIAAFYDRRGRFGPTFEFRNQPEAGDLAGGYVDLEDARQHAGDPNHLPAYLPVNVGTPQGDTSGAAIPDFTIGDSGYVADNVSVTIGSVVPFTRPYFHPTGAEVLGAPQASDANPAGTPSFVPVVVMTQDQHILAAPASPTPQTLMAYQASYASTTLAWGVAGSEAQTAIDPGQPFGLQLPPLPPAGKGGLLVFSRGAPIPENAAVPALWPAIAFVKLADEVDDAGRIQHDDDPQSLVVQGTPEETNVSGKPPKPIVVIQGITLDGDSLARTIVGPVATAPTIAALRDHVTVLIRPAALCFDPRRVDLGGLLVTPFATSQSADASEMGDKPLFDPKAVRATPGVRDVAIGCLPKGRYAMSAVYPTGQAWTTPNEMGGCAPTEGPTAGAMTPATCAARPRPVLLSQGPRAVLEIVGARDPNVCVTAPVPDACTSLP
jgi:hypothetical protein